MFYRLMLKRSAVKYRKNYRSIILIFIATMLINAVLVVYLDSVLNYDAEIVTPYLRERNESDFRIYKHKPSPIEQEIMMLFANVNGISMYIDGELLRINMEDEKEYYSIINQLNQIVASHNAENEGDAENWLHIHDTYHRIVIVGNDAESKVGRRIGTTVLQSIITIAAIMAMSLVFRDYIEQRAGDIRTLNSIGIGENKLHGLFFRECNLLFIPSTIIGIALGTGIVYLFCLICEGLTLDATNYIFPVFKCSISSLLYIVVFGYLAIYVTYRITFSKILKLDSYGQYADSALAFDHWKSRDYYFKADRHFDNFMIKAIRKRSSKSYIGAGIISSIIIAFGFTMLNITNVLICIDQFGRDRSSVDIRTSIANMGEPLMIAIMSIVFSMIILWFFTKRNLESIAPFVRTVYAIGADVDLAYSSFGRSAYLGMIRFEVIGFALGFAVTAIAYLTSYNKFRPSIPLILALVLLAGGYYFLNIACVKRYFFENCRDDSDRGARCSTK